MFVDHDNPTQQPSAAAAAPAQESEPVQTEANQEPAASSADPEESSAPAAASPEPQAAGGEAPPADAASSEAATSAEAEESAAAAELGQLIEQYAESHEVPAQSEILEAKVVAYTEQGVVVDLGLKSEGLIPAAEFTDTDLPRPDPGSTIEVQRSGEVKEGYVLVSYQKVDVGCRTRPVPIGVGAERTD